MELGLHIADYSWEGGPPELGRRLAKHAQDAEAIGMTRVTVMDHVWQMDAFGLGPYESEMLEAYSVLSFLAAVTERVRLHTLVTAAAFRRPGMLAKQVSALDVLPGGRAGLGIGAGWSVDESEGLGLPVPPPAERFAMFEETIRICLQMWSDSEEPFSGAHNHLARTLNSPQALQRPNPYLLIGGEGERRTLRLVARYADACNIGLGPQTSHKLEVLRRHCETIGRDFDDIEKTTMFAVGPESALSDVLRTIDVASEARFTTAYIFAYGMPRPERVIDLLQPAVAQAW